MKAWDEKPTPVEDIGSGLKLEVYEAGCVLYYRGEAKAFLIERVMRRIRDVYEKYEGMIDGKFDI